MIKKFTSHLLFAISFLFFQFGIGQASVQNSPFIGNEDQILHISANMVINTADELLNYVDRAKGKGANTVLFSDSKLSRFGLNGTVGSRWDTEMRKFVDGVKQRDMKLFFITITMGFNGSMLSNTPELTTGYPIKNQKLIAENGILKPVSSANFSNGGFENYNNNTPENWTFQDAEGERTFIDTTIKYSGNASFRADARNNEMSRVITTFDVQPFNQYTLTFWIKTENLTAQNVLAIIRDDNNRDRNLTNLRLSTPKQNGGRSYFNKPSNLTIDWTEIRIAFNSLEATKVNLGLSLFGGQNGSIWWDEVTVEDSPTLNWLNRDDLPKSILKSNGQPLVLGTDVSLPIDELLGQSGFSGSYDTQHLATNVSILSSNQVAEGDVATINGYHALPTADGQVSASWNSPRTYELMRTIHEKLYNEYVPDGFLLNYSEIRTGGWEPLDIAYPSSGAALAASIEQAYEDLFDIAPNAKHYFWADMADPFHNAKANYYQVNNSLDESWLTLNPDKVTIATWWEGEKITDIGPESLRFFSDIGFKQIIGGYYDADVNDNYNRWSTAAEGVDNIVGSIFATWQKDYSNIEAFGDLWWEERVLNTNVFPKQDDIKIHPVPAQDEVIIEAPKSILTAMNRITIYDLLGKLWTTEEISSNAITSIKINTRSIANGVYILSIDGINGELYNEKLVIKK